MRKRGGERERVKEGEKEKVRQERNIFRRMNHCVALCDELSYNLM